MKNKKKSKVCFGKYTNARQGEKNKKNIENYAGYKLEKD